MISPPDHARSGDAPPAIRSHVQHGLPLFAVVVAVLLGCAGWLAAPAALAQTAPPPPPLPVPGPDLTELPAGLQKYVPGSAAFAAAPWMTAPSCKDRGGDFSVWAANVIADTPALLAYFQPSSFGPAVAPEDKPRNDAILAGYRELAGQESPRVPPGYCVDDLQRWSRWAAVGPGIAPFGFAWAVTDGDGHRSSYHCTPDTGLAWSVGADRAPCDGFFLACAPDMGPEDQHRCAVWNSFSDKYVRQVDYLRGRAIDRYPGTATATVITRVSWGRLAITAAVVCVLCAAVTVLAVRALRRRATPAPDTDDGRAHHDDYSDDHNSGESGAREERTAGAGGEGRGDHVPQP